MTKIYLGNLDNQEKLIKGQKDITSKLSSQNVDISTLSRRGGV